MMAGMTWKPLIDQSQSTSHETLREDAAPSPARGRFIRVTFPGLPTGKPASLAELEVFGAVE